MLIRRFLLKEGGKFFLSQECSRITFPTITEDALIPSLTPIDTQAGTSELSESIQQ